MPFLDRPIPGRPGRRIHYTRTGEGPGVVLVPGLGSGARQFGTLPRRFARDGFTCAAVDPVGLPPSGPLPDEGYAFAEAARDVLAVAAELPAPVALVGTSLGGKVALQAAALPAGGDPASDPASGTAGGTVARAVLLCSSAVRSARGESVYRWFELLATEVDGALLGACTAPFLFGRTFHERHPQVVADVVRATNPTAEGRALMAAQCRALRAFDGEAVARACDVPVLCLAGAEDTLTEAEDVAATARLLRRGRSAVVPGAGHSLLLESAAAFAEVVAFLREARSAP